MSANQTTIRPLVERLRLAPPHSTFTVLVKDAADEIERLRAALRAIMEADKVHGSRRGLLVGPSYEIAKRVMDDEQAVTAAAQAARDNE